MAVLLDHEVPGDEHHHPSRRVAGAGAAHSLAEASLQSRALHDDPAGLRVVFLRRQGIYLLITFPLELIIHSLRTSTLSFNIPSQVLNQHYYNGITNLIAVRSLR